MKKIFSCIIAIMLVMFAAVPAFAASSDVKSPEGTLKYKITIGDSVGGSGDYKFTSEINSNGEQNVRLNATADPNYKFDHWVIEGSYTTNASLNDAALDIVITSDVVATPYFTKIGGSTEPTQAGTTAVVQKDTSPSSPKTGRNDVPLYAVILFALAACSVATVKFVKSK